MDQTWEVLMKQVVAEYHETADELAALESQAEEQATKEFTNLRNLKRLLRNSRNNTLLLALSGLACVILFFSLLSSVLTDPRLAAYMDSVSAGAVGSLITFYLFELYWTPTNAILDQLDRLQEYGRRLYDYQSNTMSLLGMLRDRSIRMGDLVNSIPSIDRDAALHDAAQLVILDKEFKEIRAKLLRRIGTLRKAQDQWRTRIGAATLKLQGRRKRLDITPNEVAATKT